MNKDYIICIPARSDSKRVHEKLYVEFNGKSLIQIVWEKCKESGAQVIVLCKDYMIKAFCKSFGADTFKTSGNEINGTEAIAEFVEKGFCESEKSLVSVDLKDKVIVNVQGDEIGINVKSIEQVSNILYNSIMYPMGTLVTHLDIEDYENPNIVKVITNKFNEAIYFSRADIPASKIPNLGDCKRYKHMGLYSYSVDFLKIYRELQNSWMEHIESLEQLRALYNGYKIICDKAINPYPKGIDSYEDIERWRKIL